MKKIALTVMAASMVFLSGCGPKIDTSKAVIKVNDSVITKKMVDDSMKKNSAPFGNVDGSKPENKFIYLIYKNKTVNDLIIKDILDQEAVKRKIVITDKDIDSEIDKIISQVGSKSKFEKILSSRNLSKETLRELIKSDIQKNRLAESLLGAKKVSDSQVKDFYAKNEDKIFKHPEQVKASHILISASQAEIRSRLESSGKMSAAELNKKVLEEMDKARAKAEKVLAKVKANPDKFAEIAKKESQDTTTAEKGGDLGFFTNKEMVPAFSKVAFSTKPGEISGIVQTEFGYHIIKVVDRKKAGLTPYDEVKPQIQKYLEMQDKRQALQKLMESSRNNAKITYLDKEYDPKQIESEIREQVKNQRMGKMPMGKRPPNFPGHEAKK